MASTRSRARWTVFACVLALAGASSADAQNRRTVSGTVSDSSGRPIPYVNIDGGARYRTLTNASGEFTFSLPSKEGLDIAVRRIGFLPGKFRVEPGGDTAINVSLQQLAVLLTTQVVRAQQQVRVLETRDFYSRMLDQQRGSLVGEFVTPEEVEMRNPQRVTQLLEQRRGISVRRADRCQVIATCFRVFGSGGCAATVFLDGQRLNSLGTAAAGRERDTGDRRAHSGYGRLGDRGISARFLGPAAVSVACRDLRDRADLDQMTGTS